MRFKKGIMILCIDTTGRKRNPRKIKALWWQGKNHIEKKIAAAKNKMNHEQNMVQKWVKKLDLKNEQTIKIEKEFSQIKEETSSKIND